MSLLVCVVLSLAACETGSSGSTVVPGGQGNDSQLRPEGSFEGESIDELQLRLERLGERQNKALSLSTHDPDQCEELCELAHAICEVKTKMCELADERPSDSEYQDLCRTAKQRCQQASESCVSCVQHHQRASEPGQPTPANCGGD